MGLIRAAITAASTTVADQWKEFFYCDALDKNTLVVEGQKRITGRSSNTKGSDNVISNGSGIAVADGQCMIIVDQGRIVEVCAEPGEFTYDSSSEPSIFAGSLGESLKNSFNTALRRITYGGDTARVQKVYYFNTKEITDNKFGTSTPISFRVVDKRINLDTEVDLRCNGVYSYRLTDPILFYTQVCGNVDGRYDRSQIDMQLKTEFISALQPAMARIAEMEIRPYAIPAHMPELCEFMNEELTKQWSEKRGISVFSVAMNPPSLTEEDSQKIKQLQRAVPLTDPAMAAATLVGAQSEAMVAAANNQSEGGAMMGFVGMNMAQQAGGMNAQGLFQMAAANQQNNNNNNNSTPPPSGGGGPQPSADSWTCSCGTSNTSKFCMNCGKPKPEDANGWTCSCGAVNKGNFCMECGQKRPAGAPLYRCDKCGWEPEDPTKPPKFCPECGDIFDEKDKV